VLEILVAYVLHVLFWEFW